MYLSILFYFIYLSIYRSIDLSIYIGQEPDTSHVGPEEKRALAHLKSEGCISFPVVRFLAGQSVTVLPKRFEYNRFGIGCIWRSALPLQLAWAWTIHKSLGMTIEYVSIDLTGVFTSGQAYVAMSRGRSRDTTQIMGFERKVVITDPLAQLFYQRLESSDDLWDDIPFWDA